MKIKVMFFNDQLIDVIGAGIYKIIICKDERERILYIGESVFVLVRCAQHLFELNKKPEYFGFTDNTIDDPEILLKFQMVDSVADKKDRKMKEKYLIDSEKPLVQSGIKDYMKRKNDKIDSVNGFINNTI
ncbi:hypothetical protein [uncultured Eubacterium sp.]|uniref:hypothetical protein n=1 Tax=uncultured Eubacterium sp. TaxID=165185 RepID=UPI0025FDDF47|nr:hypothetical protein [uncultured Eubacterium sp.]